MTAVSPCVDTGDPNLADNDGTLPPGLGSGRNDMGAYGGPLNAQWSWWDPADIDQSQTVNVTDLLQLLAAWGACGSPSDCPADIDCSGSVDVSDLLTLLARWG